MVYKYCIGLLPNFRKFSSPAQSITTVAAFEVVTLPSAGPSTACRNSIIQSWSPEAQPGVGFHAAAEIARQRPEYCVILASRKDTAQSAKTINAKSSSQSNVRFMPLDPRRSGERPLVRQRRGRTRGCRRSQSFFSTQAFNFLAQCTIRRMASRRPLASIMSATLCSSTSFSLISRTEVRVVLTASGVQRPSTENRHAGRDHTWQRNGWPTRSAKTSHMDGRQRYSTSKLCNVLWTYALDRRCKPADGQDMDGGSPSDPGLMPGTGLAREYGRVYPNSCGNTFSPPWYRCCGSRCRRTCIGRTSRVPRWLLWPWMREKRARAACTMRDGGRSSPASIANDEAKQEDLWAWTVRTLAATEQEKRQFEIV